MIQKITALVVALIYTATAYAATPRIIRVNPPKSADATAAIASALKKASHTDGPVVISLAPGRYHLHSDRSTVRPYRVSNTASESEHPTADKHVGILMRHLSDITIDGHGQATIITHGEMTPWVIDSCRNITLTGLTIDAADPSVTEMTVTSVTDSTLTARPHPDSRYYIRDGRLYWRGEGWEFTDGIAQRYRPDALTSTRCPSPVADAIEVSAPAPDSLIFRFANHTPDIHPGDTYQMRHSIRNEVAGLINGTTGITLRDMHLAFMGNFGIVSQMSADLTFSSIDCSPLKGSGRTAAGFADFLQFSSCRGLIAIDSCNFAGSHDDPINIHGTHQKIISSSPGRLDIRYMHPQTFGFIGFTPGDSIAITDPVTLLPVMKARVRSAAMTDRYVTRLDIDSLTPLPGIANDISLDGLIVENLTWCPEVTISGCRFTLTPTRGILVSTRRPVSITDCTFLRCPMPAILIADDGRSWYESGPVTDVTIARNQFIDCVSPAILIAPEAQLTDSYVHSGIKVTDNTFISAEPIEISARSVNGFTVTDNQFITPDGRPQTLRLTTTHVR